MRLDREGSTSYTWPGTVNGTGAARRAASTRPVRYTSGGSVSISTEPVSEVRVVARKASGAESWMWSGSFRHTTLLYELYSAKPP